MNLVQTSSQNLKSLGSSKTGNKQFSNEEVMRSISDLKKLIVHSSQIRKTKYSDISKSVSDISSIIGDNEGAPKTEIDVKS